MRPDTIAELCALSPTMAAVMDEAMRQREAEDRARAARNAASRPRHARPQTHLALSAQEPPDPDEP